MEQAFSVLTQKNFTLYLVFIVPTEPSEWGSTQKSVRNNVRFNPMRNVENCYIGLLR
jgi:hypothetical protein